MYYPEGYDPERLQMPPEAFSEIVELLKQGFTTLEISEETGWAKGTIRKVRRMANVPKVQGFWDKDTDAIAESYMQGDKVTEICSKHEISTTQMYSILAAVGVPVRKYDPFIQEGRQRQLDEAVEMYKKGFPIYEIEQECGIHQVTIHKEVKKRGVPLRRPR